MEIMVLASARISFQRNKDRKRFALAKAPTLALQRARIRIRAMRADFDLRFLLAADGTEHVLQLWFNLWSKIACCPASASRIVSLAL